MKSGKRWTKNEIIDLVRQGKSLQEIKGITGLSGRLIGAYKGYFHSPLFAVSQGGARRAQTQPPPSPGPEAGSRRQGGLTPYRQYSGGEQGVTLTPGEPPISPATGPAEAPALSIIEGKPYLVRLPNVYVTPDLLKLYQLTVARGYKGSVGEFMEACTLKLFETRYGLVPAVIRLPKDGT
jgi:hypothetical protein